jgi:hypothetical protein
LSKRFVTSRRSREGPDMNHSDDGFGNGKGG